MGLRKTSLSVDGSFGRRIGRFSRRAHFLLKKKVPKGIMGIKVIIKSAGLNPNRMRSYVRNWGKKNF
jgi:hypothetical protein